MGERLIASAFTSEEIDYLRAQTLGGLRRRIRPTRIVNWGLEQREVGAGDYRPNARSV